MSESDTALHDEEVFSDELPDAGFGGCGEQMLGGAREFRYDWILLRARDLHEAGDRPPSCSARMRRGRSRRTSPSCRSWCGGRSLQ
jgi:hypothetical protein